VEEQTSLSSSTSWLSYAGNSLLILIGQIARQDVATPGKGVASPQISVWRRQGSAVSCSSSRVIL